jgi:low temperature requirement protein LtrA
MSEHTKSIWWGPPRNFADRPDERKISWLELFYDLVYVAAVSQMTGQLAKDMSWSGLGVFLFFFSLIFWSWVNGSLYHDIHGSENVRTRFFTLLQMLAVAAVAITFPDLAGGHHVGFAISFSCVQGLLLFLWWSTGYYDHSHRALNRYYVLNYSIAFLLFVASIFTGFTTAYILWALAWLANYSVNFLTAPSFIAETKRRGIEFGNSSSMIERYGLFTIIVLGETILGVVHGVAEVHDKTAAVWIPFILGIMIAFSLWWICFDMLSDKLTKPGFWYFVVLTLMCFPLLSGLAVLGPTMQIILEETADHHNAVAKSMLCAGIAATISFTILIAHLMKQPAESERAVTKLSIMLGIAAALIIAMGFAGNYLNTTVFMAAITAILLAPVFFGTRIWLAHKLFEHDTGNQ